MSPEQFLNTDQINLLTDSTAFLLSEAQRKFGITFDSVAVQKIVDDSLLKMQTPPTEPKAIISGLKLTRSFVTDGTKLAEALDYIIANYEDDEKMSWLEGIIGGIKLHLGIKEANS